MPIVLFRYKMRKNIGNAFYKNCMELIWTYQCEYSSAFSGSCAALAIAFFINRSHLLQADTPATPERKENHNRLKRKAIIAEQRAAPHRKMVSLLLGTSDSPLSLSLL